MWVHFLSRQGLRGEGGGSCGSPAESQTDRALAVRGPSASHPWPPLPLLRRWVRSDPSEPVVPFSETEGSQRRIFKIEDAPSLPGLSQQ